MVIFLECKVTRWVLWQKREVLESIM